MSDPSPEAATDMIALALKAWGCSPAQCAEMASQLDRRARQLAEQENKSYEDALVHLLGLMRQGWAAKNAESSGHPAPQP